MATTAILAEATKAPNALLEDAGITDRWGTSISDYQSLFDPPLLKPVQAAITTGVDAGITLYTFGVTGVIKIFDLLANPAASLTFIGDLYQKLYEPLLRVVPARAIVMLALGILLMTISIRGSNSNGATLFSDLRKALVSLVVGAFAVALAARPTALMEKVASVLTELTGQVVGGAETADPSAMFDTIYRPLLGRVLFGNVPDSSLEAWSKAMASGSGNLAEMGLPSEPTAGTLMGVFGLAISIAPALLFALAALLVAYWHLTISLAYWIPLPWVAAWSIAQNKDFRLLGRFLGNAVARALMALIIIAYALAMMVITGMFVGALLNKDGSLGSVLGFLGAQGLFLVLNMSMGIYALALIGLFFISSKKGALAKTLRLTATKGAMSAMGAEDAGGPSRQREMLAAAAAPGMIDRMEGRVGQAVSDKLGLGRPAPVSGVQPAAASRELPTATEPNSAPAPNAVPDGAPAGAPSGAAGPIPARPGEPAAADRGELPDSPPPPVPSKPDEPLGADTDPSSADAAAPAGDRDGADSGDRDGAEGVEPEITYTDVEVAGREGAATIQEGSDGNYYVDWTQADVAEAAHYEKMEPEMYNALTSGAPVRAKDGTVLSLPSGTPAPGAPPVVSMSESPIQYTEDGRAVQDNVYIDTTDVPRYTDGAGNLVDYVGQLVDESGRHILDAEGNPQLSPASMVVDPGTELFDVPPPERPAATDDGGAPVTPAAMEATAAAVPDSPVAEYAVPPTTPQNAEPVPTTVPTTVPTPQSSNPEPAPTQPTSKPPTASGTKSRILGGGVQLELPLETSSAISRSEGLDLGPRPTPLAAEQMSLFEMMSE